VSEARLSVSGITAPGAVVSVNGRLAAVDAAGAFQLPLSLEEGPNTIQVVASDADGNQAYALLTVIYEP
jgi:uncharacterized protein YfaP (DUF2135 family)